MHGDHAQNYLIFAPARDKDWCMFWGPVQWVKAMLYTNASYRYDFEQEESGKLTLEFWITSFDFVGCSQPREFCRI